VGEFEAEKRGLRAIEERKWIAEHAQEMVLDVPNGRTQVVTAAAVSLAIGVLVAAVSWLGLTQNEIDRGLLPLRQELSSLEQRISDGRRLVDQMQEAIDRRLDQHVLTRDLIEVKERLDEIDTQQSRHLEVLDNRVVVIEQQGSVIARENLRASTQVQEGLRNLSQRVENLAERLRTVEGAVGIYPQANHPRGTYYPEVPTAPRIERNR
jgi:hypothetical protein